MDWTNPLVVGPLCTGLGVLVGIFIMRLLGGNGRSAQKAADELRTEFDEYRATVGQHFATTSDLFQDMTEKYRDVYNHMASGAQEFGGRDTAAPRLEIVSAAERLDGTPDATPDTSEGVADAPTPATDTPTPPAEHAIESPAAQDTPEQPVDYDSKPTAEAAADDIVIEPKPSDKPITT